MDSIHIRGGNRLTGDIPISGAKNAALPLMTAALLTDETVKFHNMPQLTDVQTLGKLLNVLGAELEPEIAGHSYTLSITTPDIVSTTARWLQVSNPGHVLDPGPFGTLGTGAPSVRENLWSLESFWRILGIKCMTYSCFRHQKYEILVF